LNLAQSFALGLLQAAVLLALAPLLRGVIKKMKAAFQTRQGPPLLQGYYDLAKLLRKEPVRSETASWVFVAGPRIYFATAVAATMLIPVLFAGAPLEQAGGILVLVGLLALGRFALATASLDTGSPFGGMGGSREMTVAALAEPALMLGLFTVALWGGSLNLGELVRTTTVRGPSGHPSELLAAAALFIVLLAEAGRVPVDNPATHLELTMIHEALVLEYSGRHLALIEWAAALKLFAYSCAGLALFFPWGVAEANDHVALLLALPVLVAKLAIGGFLLAFIETLLAKMRIFRVPEYLASAFLLGVLALLVHLLLGA